MTQARLDEIEFELKECEAEYEAHNEVHVCGCPLCKRYERMSGEYQVEQNMRCGHV